MWEVREESNIPGRGGGRERLVRGIDCAVYGAVIWGGKAVPKAVMPGF